GATCTTLGYDGGGTLSCNTSCTLDMSGCHRKENCDTPGDEDGNHKADCQDDACSSRPACMQLAATMVPPSTPVSTRISITLRGLNGTNHFANGTVVVVSAPEGAAVVDPVGTAGANGEVSFDLIMGRAAGSQTFQATVPGSGKSYPIELFATELDQGT